jgi:hypothetical protein
MRWPRLFQIDERRSISDERASKTAELRNGMFDEGSISLQHGAGAIKFRNVQIKSF